MQSGLTQRTNFKDCSELDTVMLVIDQSEIREGVIQNITRDQFGVTVGVSPYYRNAPQYRIRHHRIGDQWKDPIVDRKYPFTDTWETAGTLTTFCPLET